PCACSLSLLSLHDALAILCSNSLDAVSDRDFAVEFAAAAALIMVHLSRFAEELVIWSSPQFGFVTVADRFCTGSSIMPQKRNPEDRKSTRLNSSHEWISYA